MTIILYRMKSKLKSETFLSENCQLTTNHSKFIMQSQMENTNDIYSILRFTGPNAHDHIRRLEDSYFQNLPEDYPSSNHPQGDWGKFKISKNDHLIWFSRDTFDLNVTTREYLLNKLQELGQGKVYEVNDNNIKFRGLTSGTVVC